MPRRSLPSLLVVLLLGASAVAAAAAPAGASHADEVTLNGTVTGPDGTAASDAVVLVGEDRTLTKFSPEELLDLAAADPGNLTVVEVGSDGRFRATVGSRRAEAAVAVSDAGISDLAYARGENATLSLRLRQRRPQTVHAHLGAVSADEQRAQLYVSLVNSGDAPIENLSVGVASLPDGWSVATVATDGSYDPDGRRITWPPVAPGAEIDTTVVLAVPEEASPGEYTVGLRAGSDTHRVGVAPETVEVLPEDTPGPTVTPLPGDGGETPAPGAEGSTPAPASTPTLTDRSAGTTTRLTGVSGPGLGPVTAVAALVLLSALFVRGR